MRQQPYIIKYMKLSEWRRRARPLNLARFIRWRHFPTVHLHLPELPIRRWGFDKDDATTLTSFKKGIDMININLLTFSIHPHGLLISFWFRSHIPGMLENIRKATIPFTVPCAASLFSENLPFRDKPFEFLLSSYNPCCRILADKRTLGSKKYTFKEYVIGIDQLLHHCIHLGIVRQSCNYLQNIVW